MIKRSEVLISDVMDLLIVDGWGSLCFLYAIIYVMYDCVSACLCLCNALIIGSCLIETTVKVLLFQSGNTLSVIMKQTHLLSSGFRDLVQCSWPGGQIYMITAQVEVMRYMMQLYRE